MCDIWKKPMNKNEDRRRKARTSPPPSHKNATKERGAKK